MRKMFPFDDAIMNVKTMLNTAPLHTSSLFEEISNDIAVLLPNNRPVIYSTPLPLSSCGFGLFKMSERFPNVGRCQTSDTVYSGR